jgi:cytosine/adenosine deaminase-related metal-dependent hydrolase
MARTLIKNALVLTMDDELGTLPTADVLIDGNHIAAVGPDLPTEADAEVIDGRERIVMPGFVDPTPPQPSPVSASASADR